MFIKTVMLLVAIIAAVACQSSTPPTDPLLDAVRAAEGTATDIYSGVYDDGHTVYIKATGDINHASYDPMEDEKRIAGLMKKKKAWHDRNPKKIVTAMTTVTSDVGSYKNGHAATIGLLLSYEQQR